MPVDKKWVGHDLGEVGTFPVERGKIREFATAILDDNPVYHEEHAPAPATFTMVQAHWGGGMRGMPDLGLDFRRILHAEQHFEFLKPVAAGDSLTVRSRISSIEEKEGKRGGTMTFVTFENEFVNQRGEVARVGRMVIVETAKAAT